MALQPASRPVGLFIDLAMRNTASNESSDVHSDDWLQRLTVGMISFTSDEAAHH
jgi:hypothetical protein